MKRKISKRIKFKDIPDWFRGRYFLFTLPYGLFYIIGSGLGYSKTGNLFCLFGSGGIGVVFTLMAVGHAIDYYNGARIASFYVAIPFSVSMFVAILMTCIYALGGRFKSSLIVACAAWPAVVIYFYALLKDYGGGSKFRENSWYSPLQQHQGDPPRRSHTAAAAMEDRTL